MIYLDNNATTPILPVVRERMLGILKEGLPLNGSATHFFGKKARDLIESARAQILRQAAPGYKLVFMPSATIANNLVMQSFVHTIVSAAEHSSILKKGASIVAVSHDGTLNTNDLIDKMMQATRPFLVSVIHGHNETGVINDIAHVADIVHEYGGLLHTDATQSFGKIIKNLDSLKADYITIAAHKIGGPLGSAALLYKNHTLLPLFAGGGQELGLCSGTENILSIAGFAEAVSNVDIDKYKSTVLPMRIILEDECTKNGAVIIAENAARLPNTVMMAKPGVSNKAQMIGLDMAGFCISIGSACSSGVAKLSPTLEAMGIDEKTASSAIRISLGLGNTVFEVEAFIRAWNSL